MSPSDFQPVIYLTPDRLVRVSRLGAFWYADGRTDALAPWRPLAEHVPSAEDAMVLAIVALGLEPDEPDEPDQPDDLSW